MPIIGYSWPERIILFHFDEGVSQKVRTAIHNAAWIWLASQQWFITNYEGGQGLPYQFEETSFTGPKFDVARGRIVPVGMQVDLRTMNSRGGELDWATLVHVATHELGHALGLGHSPIGGDLMYEKRSGSRDPLPSTLDLYAVYLISKGSLVNREVSLPSDIPYVTPPLPPLGREVPGQAVEMNAPQGQSTYAYQSDSGFVLALIAAGVISFLAGFCLARTRRGKDED